MAKNKQKNVSKMNLKKRPYFMPVVYLDIFFIYFFLHCRDVYPGKAGVWRDCGLALHPVHDVEVAHLVLVRHPDVRRPIGTQK